jgi:mannose-6-phosphate isomerase-like protein (cupin superfamily)
MKAPEQKFCTTSAAGAKWAQGLRKFFEYRDLGISEATGGAYNAHVIRVKKPVSEFPHTGPHVHDLEFQMIYVLKGWIRFTYEGQGEFTFREGDSCLQPVGIVHDELACSDDLELIEFTAPANFNTRRIEAPVDATN